MRCSKKCKIRAIYRTICKKLRKILFPQVCLHRIIQGINPRLILKYCFLCVTKYNKGKNMVLKVKQTDRSSNLTTRSREVQLPATHQDDHKCLTNVWPAFWPTFDPCLTTTNHHYIRSKQQSPPLFFCKIIFNAFTDAATLNLKEKRIISKREELLNSSCLAKLLAWKEITFLLIC